MCCTTGLPARASQEAESEGGETGWNVHPDVPTLAADIGSALPPARAAENAAAQSRAGREVG